MKPTKVNDNGDGEQIDEQEISNREMRSKYERKTDGHAVLSDELIETLENTPHEEPFLTDYNGGNEAGISEDQHPISQINDWLPESHEWDGKSHLHHEQVQALVMLDLLGEMYPEVRETADKIVDKKEQYLRMVTSVNGYSRDQQVQVLTSQFGGEGGPMVNVNTGDGEDKARSFFSKKGDD